MTSQELRRGGCAVLAVALAACGTPPVSTWSGGWKGSMKRSQAMWGSGQAIATPTVTEIGYPTWNVSIGADRASCGEQLTVEVFKDCRLQAKPEGDGATFTPGYWCEYVDNAGVTTRYTTLDGTMKLTDAKVDGKLAKVLSGTLRVAVQRKGSSNGTYMELTDVISDAVLVGEVIGHNSCVLLKNDPWVPEDFAAAAKCDAFVNRAGEADDRTVTITGATFSPACLRIAVGQTVTFAGKWNLRPGLPPHEFGIGAEGTPIPVVAYTDPARATFIRAGDYPFFSTDGSPPMQGLVRVR